MNFREKKLYHQIHPLKLATDIGVTPVFLFFFWHHQIAPALLVGFVPPVVVSAAMMIWPADLEGLKNSSLGRYVSKHMTPTIEAVRFLTLVPMAWGAWTHRFSLIGLGLFVLLLAWCNGLILSPRDAASQRRRQADSPFSMKNSVLSPNSPKSVLKMPRNYHKTRDDPRC